MNGRAPLRRHSQAREEVADCAAVVVFFLLMAALPAGSYFFLHRSLVSRYESLADTLQQQGLEVSRLRAEVAQFAAIRDTLAFSADALRDVTAQHIYAEYVAAHPDDSSGGSGAQKYKRLGRAASGAHDGGGMLGEINAAAGAVASRLWAAEDWASSKLTSSLHWSHDSSDGGGSGATHGGSGHTRAKVAGRSSGASSSSLASAGGRCIPGRGSWSGDIPAAWHHYFAPLQAGTQPEPAAGFFVDVGAGDGVFNSNTMFLEAQRCWRGIAVEPADNEYPKLEGHRARSTTVHGAVCEHDGSKLFTDVTLRGLWTGWSGFRETWDEHHMHQVARNVESNAGWAVKEYEVKCFKLQTLLNMEQKTRISYLTVSAEGHELLILRSLDYVKVTVDVIEAAVHSLVDRDQIAVFLESKGYDEDTMWPHKESVVFLHPAFRKRLAAVRESGSF